MTREFLRKLPLFADLPNEDLDRLYRMAETVTCRAGESLMEEGTAGDALYVIVDGTFEITKRAGDTQVVIAGCDAGEVIGEISLLEQASRTASVRALRDSHLVKISRDTFLTLLSGSPSAALSILRTVMSRLRNTEAMLMQNEKMAALGNLAAGLAHELNNPAAAVQRSVDQLREALDAWERRSLEMDGLGLDARQLETIQALRRESRRPARNTAEMDPLACADLESEMQAWLEERKVEGAWEVAPALVNLGWDISALQELSLTFSEVQLPVIAGWLAAGSLAFTLLDEIGVSASQISEIVKAVKTYSFLDRGPVQEVDVREGLENTLVILRHKLKEGIDVRRDFAPDLPRIEAHGSELNEVWTNIIDNAIDAMGGHGVLTLRAYAQDSRVVVEIVDNGPGIPAEIRSRIFDPFFTTKGAGSGTGLGLHIVHQIVVVKHGGRLNVESRPGETRFQITLPMRAGGRPTTDGGGQRQSDQTLARGVQP
jgi:signal transduction histidine kinase